MKNRSHAQSPITDSTSTETPFTPTPKKELVRSIRDRKIFGVCGGVAKYLGIDSTIVRIVYLVLVFASFGWGLLLYIILTLLMPEEKPTITT
ncbi:MAG: PspC domain-containing protein [Ignavibacteriae bacterium]|nr:PspC domain-containing protein [Ignavibacteriota bacterium]